VGRLQNRGATQNKDVLLGRLLAWNVAAGDQYVLFLEAGPGPAGPNEI